MFKQGDFVLYRDPQKYWTGQSGHTFVCRVVRACPGNAYDLIPLPSGRQICFADPAYMRHLPPAHAMRDIDTELLTGDSAANDMIMASTMRLLPPAQRN